MSQEGDTDLVESDEHGSTVRVLGDLLTVGARRWFDRPALASPDGDLSFAEVDELVERLASGFVNAGVGHGDRVIVSMHKTHLSFVIFHSLLRIGAVVVPIDPLMPVPSAVGLIRTFDPVALVVDEPTLQRLDPFGGGDLDHFRAGVFTTDVGDDRATAIPLLLDGSNGTTSPSGSDVTISADVAVGRKRPVAPDDLAYVIFTSGSTGTPKGIAHTHRSALAYAELAVETHGITADDRVAGMPPLHFDMSTLELYAAPLAGAASVPIGAAELRFPASFTDRSQDEALTIWYAVPFQLRQISERGAIEQRDLSTLRHVIYAGEPFSPPALRQLMEQLPGVRFSNAYGPAETNVCTVYELPGPPDGEVPIGRPWGDVDVRIVDPEAPVADGPTRPIDPVEVPDGELGELWVNASTLMAGYLDRPDLTAERCVPASGPVADSRWYRTGDLVRREGDVLYLAGRIDHQVKVRGVRLELEAIESVLVSNPDIADAVVAPVTGGASVEQLTAAVVVSPSASSLDLSILRRWCLARLPQVAVPIDIASWSEFPLTSSGKIDRGAVRRSLNDPDSSGPSARTACAAPPSSTSPIKDH